MRVVVMPAVRLLYVEDNALVRELTCELLAAEGRQIVACGSAEEAFEDYQRSAADVVITDMSLPGQSGLDLAKRILSLSPGASIIILSGYALAFPLAELGPYVRSLIKPVEARQIDDVIEELLRCAAPREGKAAT